MTTFEDINRTALRRSKLNSSYFLMNEQFNPSNRMQQEDKYSQHRGTKPLLQYVLLKAISLLS